MISFAHSLSSGSRSVLTEPIEGATTPANSAAPTASADSSAPLSIGDTVTIDTTGTWGGGTDDTFTFAYRFVDQAGGEVRGWSAVDTYTLDGDDHAVTTLQPQVRATNSAGTSSPVNTTQSFAVAVAAPTTNTYGTATYGTAVYA